MDERTHHIKVIFKHLGFFVLFLLTPVTVGYTMQARSFETLLPDYYTYLETREVCSGSPGLCIRKTDVFLRTFQTPYLVRRVKALRFKALCTPEGLTLTDGLDEIVSLASLASTSDILTCAQFLEKKFPSGATALYRLAFLRGDRLFLKVKNHYIPPELSNGELKGLVQKLIRVDYDRPYDGLKMAREMLLMYEDKIKDKDLFYSLLGEVYMRMKRYPESAEAFKRAKRYYQSALAYIRARDLVSLDKLINQLKKKGEPEVYRVILLKAEQMRRDGRLKEVEQLLWEVYKFSDRYREESLWALAWLAYLQRDLYSSMARLKRLYLLWPKDRYAYWFKKVLEKMGEKGWMNRVSFRGDNFYTVLADSGKGAELLKKVAYRRSNIYAKDLDNRALERAWALNLLGEDELSIDEVLWQYERAMVSSTEACEFFRKTGAWQMMPWCEMRLPGDEGLYFRYPYAYPEVLDRVSQKTGLDPLLILSVMKQESRFDPHAISPSGAIGLMQLMPFTAKRFIKGQDPIHRECMKVDKNITAGARYLRFLIDRFQNIALAVAAYNAGEGNVSRWLRSYPYESIDEFIEDIPYGQTYHYTQKVLFYYYHYQRLYEELSLKTETD